MLQLDAWDNFGTSVSLNASGDRLAVGAFHDDGFGNSVSYSGAVYLFSATYEQGEYDPQGLSYGAYGHMDVTVDRSELSNLLSSGTSVILQASNDITVAGAVTATGTAGNLSLWAGRSILINADISTTADLTLIANDLLANGVIDRFRDAGNAVIQMADTTSITANNLTIDLRDGTGLTHRTAGDLTLAGITAGNATISSVNLAGSGAAADNKVYDGNTTATVTAGNLAGLQLTSSSNLTLNRIGSFNDKNAGNNKPVTVNWTLTVPGGAGDVALASAATTADITAAITPAPATPPTIDAGTILDIINLREQLPGIASAEILAFIDSLQAMWNIFEPGAVIKISDLHALLGGDASANAILLEEAVILLR